MERAGSHATTREVTLAGPSAQSLAGRGDHFICHLRLAERYCGHAGRRSNTAHGQRNQSDFGPTTGGTSVTVTGTAFTGATAVHFGTATATFTVVSSTSITATAPAGTGTVNVTVTTAGGTSATSADKFTYDAPRPP